MIGRTPEDPSTEIWKLQKSMDLTYTQQRVRARKNVSDSDSITSSISDTNAIDDIGSQSDNSQIGAGSNDSDGDSEEAEGVCYAYTIGSREIE